MAYVKKPVQFQVADEFHAQLLKISKERGCSISEIIRNALKVYQTLLEYEKEGKRVVVEDKREPTSRMEIILL